MRVSPYSLGSGQDRLRKSWRFGLPRLVWSLRVFLPNAFEKEIVEELLGSS
jgi:hypothetical protein